MQGTKTKLREGAFRLRVYEGRRPSGTPIQRTESFYGSAKAADSRLRDMVTEAEQRRGMRSDEITFAEVIDEWLEDLVRLKRSPTTLREYRRIADNVVKPALGSIKVGELRPEDLRRLYRALDKRGNGPATIQRVHSLIGAALGYAEHDDIVVRNVARRVKVAQAQRAQISPPSPEEVQLLVETAFEKDPTMAGMILFAAFTGMRRGELCGLRWSDIDFNAATVLVERSIYAKAGGGWGEKSTKTHASRRVDLAGAALELLERLRAEADRLAKDLGLKPPGESAFIFSRSPQGLEPIMPDVLTKFLSRVAAEAGVKTHLHAVRHFFATQGIASGMDLVTVRDALGHSSITITADIYSEATAKRSRQLAEAVAGTLALPSGD